MQGSRLFMGVIGRCRAGGKRQFSTSKKRLSGDHDDGGIVGGNLPFDIHNRYKFTLLFTAFFGSGFGLPFLVVRHQLLKKSVGAGTADP
ncbi:hypothetical protein RvY_09499 [Ramazzottius varieornatus]|uniref:Cytochrome c oxidase subunit 7C, mitochondrial n=1 Tax=Ramazzottius varieornatus TaxID=947166 RepID=A0A1D1VBR4_RAMVA|nr:hypothetical protein RvY_09499 [Ramazzottius varieornatus]